VPREPILLFGLLRVQYLREGIVALQRIAAGGHAGKQGEKDETWLAAYSIYGACLAGRKLERWMR